MADILSVVQAEVAQLPESIRNGTHAALVLTLAELLASAGATNADRLSRELRMVLAELRQLAADARVGVSRIDELAERRTARRTAAVSDRAGGEKHGGGRRGGVRGAGGAGDGRG